MDLAADAPDDVAASVEWLRSDRIVKGKRTATVLPGLPMRAGLRLHTWEGAWILDQGPSLLWRALCPCPRRPEAFGALPGLAAFFPPLPPSALPGSQRRELLTWTDPEVAAEPDGALLPYPPAPERLDTISVRVARWIAVNDVPAAVLLASAEPSCDLRGKLKGTLEGRFVILRTGRLLHGVWAGEMEADDRKALLVDLGPHVNRRTHAFHEIRLVGAPDGPVLRDFGTGE
jgi:hypothetical protein